MASEVVVNTYINLSKYISKLTKLNASSYKFNLATLGFNDHDSPVPSRSFNRVPTVILLLKGQLCVFENLSICENILEYQNIIYERAYLKSRLTIIQREKISNS